jgi:16S rRNA (cytosine967-C5)-methyltransferase
VSSRSLSAVILTSVLRDHESLTDTLLKKIPPSLPDRDKGLIKEYSYGVLRWYFRLRIIADSLVYKPIKSKEQEIASLLLLGLYQLIYLKTPPHAAVSETVSAASTLKKPWAKGVLNQALRQFIQHSDEFLKKAEETEEGQFSHPQWLIETLKKSWPLHWQDILAANNSQAPLFLRVNPLQNTRDEYLLKLRQHGIDAMTVPDLPQALCLTSPEPIDRLPGFHQGCCSVQDLASQWITAALDLQPHQRVLDACSAPGGKAAHLLETEPNLAQLIAIDQNEHRLQRVKDNFQRLNIQTPFLLLTADASRPDLWWDGQCFDRILLDAPCSGTGVIRRHPDIKVLRRPEDIPVYAEQQLQLLTALWPLLKPGGRLLYTTCSILPEENVKVIQRFCDQQPDAQLAPIPFKHGFAQEAGYQLMPQITGHDGFYYALLIRIG